MIPLRPDLSIFPYLSNLKQYANKSVQLENCRGSSAGSVGPCRPGVPVGLGARAIPFICFRRREESTLLKMKSAVVLLLCTLVAGALSQCTGVPNPQTTPLPLASFRDTSPCMPSCPPPISAALLGRLRRCSLADLLLALTHTNIPPFPSSSRPSLTSSIDRVSAFLPLVKIEAWFRNMLQFRLEHAQYPSYPKVSDAGQGRKYMDPPISKQRDSNRQQSANRLHEVLLVAVLPRRFVSCPWGPREETCLAVIELCCLPLLLFVVATWQQTWWLACG